MTPPVTSPGGPLAPAAVYGTAHVTRRAPHVRVGRDLGGLTRETTWALLPCVAMGLYSTGYQANAAMADLGVSAAPGWRGALIELTGLGYGAASAPANVLHGLLYLLPLLLVSVVTTSVCEHVFARTRARTTLPGGLLVALLFVLGSPPTLPLWQAALGVAFGVVVGREIFGGTGRNFLNPALTGLAFVYFAFPPSMRAAGVWTPVEGFTGPTNLELAAAGGLEALRAAGVTWSSTFFGRAQGALGETSTLACALGAAYLIARRIVSWRVLAGAVAGLAATLWVLPASEALPLTGVPFVWHLTLGSFAFGVVFFATDPVSSPATDAGRWIYGLLIGFLVVLIRVASPVHTEGVILAILLGNIFAPLIDHGVVWVHTRRRRRRG